MSLSGPASPPPSTRISRGYSFKLAQPSFAKTGLLALALMAVLARPAPGASFKECQQLYLTGQYAQCAHMAAEQIERRALDERWDLLKSRSELTLGQYDKASATVENALKRYSWSVQLRLVGRTAALYTGDQHRADVMLGDIARLAGGSPGRFTDVENLVAIGESALLMGSDAREVLDALFERAKKLGPDRREPYLAIGQLALDKRDFQLAAEVFAGVQRQFPDDPDVLFGLARAYADSDPQRSQAALSHALEKNPFHVPALLFMADRLIAAERYDAADEALDKVLGVNPLEPAAWSYRALLAQLEASPSEAELYRNIALSTWQKNPEVDYLIGQELSQKYRFVEGAAHQRRALQFDANYLPAKAQLSQDLLRLGLEVEGWRLADEVHAADGYDVATFNLLELRDKLDGYRTLEDENFLLRMESREADIYGDRALRLLNRAKDVLCAKYGMELQQKITVEIFPENNDFAVRTFGMPAISGFLGVCFGKVITANSPASHRENPSSWEAVLWHEFCHVVTLELTHNRMPRWLSEGISVYEESREDPRWGQRMNPQYREMILSGGLTPISRLSEAFLSPKSGLHLQFAYYESSLVVEFLIQEYGQAAVQHILRDLGAGLPINTAIERHTSPMDLLEAKFETFAKTRAEQLAPNADWTTQELATLSGDGNMTIETFLAEHPNHFPGLTLYAAKLIEDRQWDDAKIVLRKMIELYPAQTGANAAHRMLADIHRKLDEQPEELAVLDNYASHDADALDVFLRLIEIEQENANWEAVTRNAERAMAVNPLIPTPHRALALAAEQLDRPEAAISSYRALLALDPDDPADVHFRLAVQLHAQGDSEARRHVLSALEEAPRFRDAHKLLLKIVREEQAAVQ